MYNGTWYTGSSSWAQPAGYADGADLGDIIITNGLVLGAEVKSWGEGNAAKHLPVLHYCFDYVKDVHEAWHNDLTIPYDNWDGSANVFKSADVGNADLSGLDAGPHTISLYISKLCDDDNTPVYDSGDDNYTASFTLIKVVDVPAAVTGLVYDGNSQTGVAAGTGYTLSGNAASAAGTYTATATLDQYYQWSDGTTAAKTIEWSIAPAPLTVAADNITIDHGAAAPAYTYTVTGLVEGESLATAPALSCDYAQGDGIGTYAISVTNAVTSANYVISYTPGTLTVQSKTYDVTFVDEDGTTVLKAATAYEYGTAADDIVKPDDPTKEATDEYAYTFAGWDPALEEVTEDATYTATYTSTSLAAATWIGSFLGDWDTAANWDIGYLPTSATVVTFTNNAEVGINQAKCKTIVLSNNAYVAITPASGVSEPLLHFSGNGNYTDAVSGSGTLAVNYIGLFNDNYSGELEIGTAFENLNDITFRGNASGSPAASFTITNKTTVSADAWVKSIDKASTLFTEGIDVAQGVTAYMKTLNYGRTKIGYGNVTLVANDGEGNPTAIWLMKSGASLNYGAKVVVDADHAADYYVNTREDSLGGGTYTVYEALPKPTVLSVSATGATVTGVTSGQRVVPGGELTIGATGLATGYEAVLVITKHSDGSELVNTKELPCVYAMPDYDIDVTMTAVLKTFTVTFSTDKGEVPEAQAVGYGETATEPDPAPECEGWLFNYWTLDGAEYDFDTPVTEYIELVADWTPTLQMVSFDPNGGRLLTNEVPSPRQYVIGQPYGELGKAKLDGHARTGWFTLPEGGDEVTEEDIVSTNATLILYAQWTTNQVVTFDANGGECNETNRSVTVGQKYGNLPTPKFAGHVFLGWFTEEVDGKQLTKSSTVTTKPTRTMYAQWSNEQTVTFDAHGGECDPATKVYIIGGKYKTLPTPTWDGHTFLGWYTDAENGRKLGPGSIVTAKAERTMHAYWREGASGMSITGFSVKKAAPPATRDARAAAGSVLTFDAVAGRVYELQWAAALDGEWTILRRWSAESDGEASIEVPADAAAGFFRLAAPAAK